MLKHEKLPSTNFTKSGAHKKLQKIQENKHTLENLKNWSFFPTVSKIFQRSVQSCVESYLAQSHFAKCEVRLTRSEI